MHGLPGGGGQGRDAVICEKQALNPWTLWADTVMCCFRRIASGWATFSGRYGCAGSQAAQSRLRRWLRDKYTQPC
jgi:hypothetical protein